MKMMFGEKALKGMVLKASQIINDQGKERTIEFRAYEDPNSRLIVHVRKASDAPVGGEFLPGKVENADGQILWGFASGDKIKGSMGRLLMVSDQLVIAIIDRKFVHRIIVVRNLSNSSNADGLQTAGIKKELAKEFHLKPNYSDTEERALEVVCKISKAKREEEERRLAEENDARNKARDAKVASILARGKVSGKSEYNKFCAGIPVVDGEWQMIGPNHPVVMVEGFDAEGKVIGTDGTYFVTDRDKGGRPKKKWIAAMTIQIQNNSDSAPTLVISRPKIDLSVYPQGIFDISDNDAKKTGLPVGYNQLPLVTSEQMADLKSAGLNSGTPIAITGEGYRAQIIRMTKQSDGRNTLGEFSFVQI